MASPAHHLSRSFPEHIAPLKGRDKAAGPALPTHTKTPCWQSLGQVRDKLLLQSAASPQLASTALRVVPRPQSLGLNEMRICHTVCQGTGAQPKECASNSPVKNPVMALIGQPIDILRDGKLQSSALA